MPTDFNYTRAAVILGMLLVTGVALAFGAGMELVQNGFTDMVLFGLFGAIGNTIAFGWAAFWVLVDFFDHISEEKSQ